MIMWERPLCRDSRDTEVPPTLEMINRLPILIRFDSRRANRFSQLRIAPRAAYNFQLQTLTLVSAYDHKLAVSLPLEKLFVRSDPV